MSIKTLCLGLLILAYCIPGYTQAPDTAKLNRFFDRLAEKNKAMGTLCIVKDGKVQYSRSIGYSRISADGKIPASATTRYRIGSVTKMFTATMIFQLAEKNRLKLSDTLGKYFPQMPNAGKITIAHILGHRSGLPPIYADRESRLPKTVPRTKEEMLASMAKGTPEFEPGARYAYSNAGYFLLGCLIEKLTGEPYEKTLQEQITGKIGLHDTYPAGTTADNRESASFHYISEWQNGPETHPSILFGAGFLVSTPPDLAKFIRALFDGQLISRSDLNRMIQERSGIDTFQFAGKTYYGHTGGVDGFGAWLAYLPEEKLALAYATNGKVYPVGNIMNGITDIYGNRPFTIPSFEPFAVSIDVLDKYVGVYGTSEAPVKFTITRNGATLYAQPPGQTSPFPLEPTAVDKFRLEGPGIVFEFDPAKKQMIVKRGGGQRVFNKEN
ncbi:class A beta-lactamase-related serine hydrolase [Chitinophaga lutea]|uniref:Class A beta-lactamase-related serine hydrolase n=1 Tax=Chitinophaga lutea TaxID=2488634 RepID=A0A3N4Q5L0_9BACT|nr:serine hydrolase domain-containing protein [Chitinophaga lutea]RPE12811.1 class A beta-lactamase-related serine hydrolase [Chitinophaga lutea]